ncbi:MAG TPA: acyltransferase [Candidatus Binatia bacterium]|nr:acyltransferase [Candidatus Binatia bacterium]
MAELRENARHLRRERELDGLRGIAATMVLLFHCLSAVAATAEVQSWLLTSWPAAIANGGSAVVLFFVLSGYVLSGSFARDTSAMGAAGFLTRRVLRLYPAYLLALAAACLAAMLTSRLDHGLGESAWARAHAEQQLGLGQILRSALVPGEAYGMIPVGWTLRLELVYSLLFPLLAWFARRFDAGVIVIVIAAAATLFVTPDRLANYAMPFSVGMAMHAYRDRLALDEWSPALRAAVLVLAIAAFALPPTHLWPLSRFAGMGLATAASATLMLLAALSPLRSALRSRPLAALGEASYSLYLLHVPVVLLAAPVMLGDAPAIETHSAVLRWLALAAVVMPVTWAIAALSYRYVERPAMDAGRAWSRRTSRA